ncbi:MAG TPA: histidine--tRNA ligase [Candidatus Polarisedimenticolaceae bacterium]|nr:histidine--tRNA ligase [Candidatus Polarisedimenticolaceae bacterium]
MATRYQALRGTHDILPDDVAAWQRLEATTREVFARYGFREIRTPLLEATELFARSVGASTDIVRKEMYTLQAGDDSVTLRPESTAPVVRAFIEHAMDREVAAGYPVRLFYIGPMFRYERPQKGRQRQFHQIGAEVLGAPEPLADAETIHMLALLLDTLGIRERELRINSVGDETCAPRFRETLVAWLAERRDQLCSDCRRRMDENPLRVFDCKVEADRRLLASAPSIADALCAPCADHFAEVRRRLDALEVSWVLDARLVRGLDYYRRTVFEVVSSDLGAQNAIVGGGRYDGLVAELGGPAIPGFGFAMGMERLVSLLPAPAAEAGLDVTIIALGPEGFEAAPKLAAALRRDGVSVVMPMQERPMGAQFKRAERLGARFALYVGESEVRAGRYPLKDLRSQTQVVAGPGEVAALVREGRRDGR